MRVLARSSRGETLSDNTDLADRQVQGFLRFLHRSYAPDLAEAMERVRAAVEKLER